MSNTLNICCDDCKVVLWYGQSSNGNSYAYQVGSTTPLVEFLLDHSNHKLHSYDDSSGDSSGFCSDDYLELEIEAYKDKK
jgi:hypothetical protein